MLIRILCTHEYTAICRIIENIYDVLKNKNRSLGYLSKLHDKVQSNSNFFFQCYRRSLLEILNLFFVLM